MTLSFNPIRRLLVVLALGPAFALGVAQAQTTAPVQSAAPATTTAPRLTIRDVYDHLEAAGYRDIREIELDDGRYEVKAHDAKGQRVKLKVNAHTGAVEHERVRR